MTDTRHDAIQYARRNQERYKEELKVFSAIPSISTEPEHKPDIDRAAQWVADHLRRIGINAVKVMPTQGYPVVYGELLTAGAGTKTVLVYGHYDVQPAEPLDKWTSDPFEPVIRGENLYARGATDMKGQVLATLNAIEAVLKTGEMPVNLKFMIEGEEEVGSPHLAEFIEKNRDLLSCDMFLNPDTGMMGVELPTIVYALRGLIYFELRLVGAKSDLHSGTYGGVIHNPAQVICELIAGMHTSDGKVALPGFYDRVREIPPDERAELTRLPFDEAFYIAQTGAPAVWEGEKGYSPFERAGVRPTLEVNGLFSGFTGVGSKTVLPNYAMAKISCRLVPNQHPDEVHKSMLKYLEASTPKTVRYELLIMPGNTPASLSNRHSAGVAALSEALETVWGKKPLYKPEGGSVPVVSQVQQLLGVDAINTGFSLPDDGMHGPNEKLHLPTWSRGTEALIHFFFNLS